MNKNGLYAFYGTLRNGMENHLLYKSGMVFLESVALPGFCLYSAGEYPYAVRSPMPHRIIQADLFKITDPIVAEAIHAMELEVDYFYDEVDVKGTAYGIYLFPAPRVHDAEIVSGDWVQYIA